MGSGTTATTGKFAHTGNSFPAESVRALLDTVDKGMVVASREGQVLMLNARAKKCLEEHGKNDPNSLNIFEDLLNVSPREIFRRIESGEHEIEINGRTEIRAIQARVRWIPESDWLAVQFANDATGQDGNTALQPTVQELLQER